MIVAQPFFKQSSIEKEKLLKACLDGESINGDGAVPSTSMDSPRSRVSRKKPKRTRDESPSHSDSSKRVKAAVEGIGESQKILAVRRKLHDVEGGLIRDDPQKSSLVTGMLSATVMLSVPEPRATYYVSKLIIKQ